MYDFEYVDKEEWKPVRDDLLDLIHNLQNEVREHFTFQFRFVGSSKRNMITRNRRGNQGFDFDVDIEIKKMRGNYSPEQIRNILRNTLDRITDPNGRSPLRYDCAENSTRVLTIKVKDRENARILHSFDFCVLRVCEDGRRQYIRKNGWFGNHTWEYQSEDYEALPDKIDWVKRLGHWQEVRDLYLRKKNNNFDSNKRSRSLFAEAVHEIWQKY